MNECKCNTPGDNPSCQHHGAARPWAKKHLLPLSTDTGGTGQEEKPSHDGRSEYEFVTKEEIQKFAFNHPCPHCDNKVLITQECVACESGFEGTGIAELLTRLLAERDAFREVLIRGPLPSPVGYRELREQEADRAAKRLLPMTKGKTEPKGGEDKP